MRQRPRFHSGCRAGGFIYKISNITIQLYRASLLGRADRNGQRVGGFRGRQHVAASIENSARLNHKAWRVNLSGHNALGLNFHSALGKNHAIEFASDNDVVPLDLTFDSRALSERQTVGREKVSLHFSVHPKNSGCFERAFKADTLIEEPCEFVHFRVLVATFRSPGHAVSPYKCNV